MHKRSAQGRCIHSPRIIFTPHSFFFALPGLINNRFSYHHEPLNGNKRNYAMFDMNAAGMPISWHFCVSDPTKGKAEQGNSVAI